MSVRPPKPDPRRLQGIPRVQWIQPGNTDDGDDAIELASAYGLIPDAWQAPIIRAWLTRRPDTFKWMHGRCGLCVPRQNGKNAAIEVRELFGLVVLGEAILHTAHEVKTNRKAFKRLLHFFGQEADDPGAKFPDLNALVSEIRKTNGQEAIVLKDEWLVDGEIVRSDGRPVGFDVAFHRRGGSIEFVARSNGSGRGFTVDLLILDEAQHLEDEDLEAIRPAVSSAPLGNPQIIYAGTPPNQDKNPNAGEVFIRVRANVGKDKKLAWVEYGAPDGPRPDLDDMALLYATNPSLEIRHANGAFGLGMDTVLGERGDLSPEGYARERLGWWGNPEAKRHRGVIDMDQWRTLRVKGDELPSRGLIVVDVAPDLVWATVALATDGPGGRPLGLVDWNEGTGWVVKRIKQLVGDLDQVLEVALTPTAHMFSADLIKAGIPLAKAGAEKTSAGVKHHKLAQTDVGAACMAVQQMITDSQVAHLAQPTLDRAARTAVTKYSGDTQVWDRRGNRKVDISPLVAWSVAVHRWALAIAKPPEEVGVPRRVAATARREPIRMTSAQIAQASTRRSTSRGFDPRSSGF